MLVGFGSELPQSWIGYCQRGDFKEKNKREDWRVEKDEKDRGLMHGKGYDRESEDLSFLLITP